MNIVVFEAKIITISTAIKFNKYYKDNFFTCGYVHQCNYPTSMIFKRSQKAVCGNNNTTNVNRRIINHAMFAIIIHNVPFELKMSYQIFW